MDSWLWKIIVKGSNTPSDAMNKSGIWGSIHF